MTQLMVEIGGVWLIAVLAGLPLFASMGLAAFVFVQLAGLSDSIVPQKMVQAMNSFPIIAAPLFILMGNILGAARITDRIVAFAGALIGWVRGGYAHASILSSMIFAGMVGSAVADAAGTGSAQSLAEPGRASQRRRVAGASDPEARKLVATLGQLADANCRSANPGTAGNRQRTISGTRARARQLRTGTGRLSA